MSVRKVFWQFREYTKDLFNGKGLFSANAENLMTINDLYYFLNAQTGVGGNSNGLKGYCLSGWFLDGTTIFGILYVPGLRILNHADNIPKGFFTPEAMRFFSENKTYNSFELLPGKSSPIRGCSTLG